jgi:hypothetical protein
MTLNVERILKLADDIEADQRYVFDMSDFVGHYRKEGMNEGDFLRENVPLHPCGTACCIAGFVKVAYSLSVEGLAGHSELMAKNFLGLNQEQVEELFYVDSGKIPLGEITRTQAVATLRRLAATGEVEWLL